MVSPPTQFLSEKMGFKEIFSITEMDLAYPNPSMAVPRRPIRKKPDMIDRFMRLTCAPCIAHVSTRKELSKPWQSIRPLPMRIS